MRQCVLAKHGELFLKGRNRGLFEERLVRNLRAVFPSACGQVTVEARRGMVVLRPQRCPEMLASSVRDVIGLATVQLAATTPKSVEAIVDATMLQLRRRFGAPLPTDPSAFAVRARRRDKSFPLTSNDLAAIVGQNVQEATGWSVDLDRPDLTIEVEVDHREAFVSVDRHRGPGGLPVGSSGHAVVLLSGGYDSPVAAYRAMRRGLRCDFVHFTGAPYTDPSSAYKAYALVQELNRYQPEARLWIVPVGKAQRALASSAEQALRTMAQRRLMVRIAERLAHESQAEALVTGDSLGQVSSQTLSNLAAVDEATSLPLLRPLLGWDKEEIMAEARRIGTGDISRLPDEDCCRLLAPRRPATSSHPDRLARVERRAEADQLIEDALQKAQVYTFPVEGTQRTSGQATG